MSFSSQKRRCIAEEDLECAVVLTSLGQSIENTYRSANRKFTNEFVVLATERLNTHTALWKMNWSGHLNEHDECYLTTKIEWPMHHAIPFDLVPQLQKLLRKFDVYDEIDFSFDSTTNTLVFHCQKSVKPESWLTSSFSSRVNTQQLVTCEGCGHQWDGNAQCMCGDLCE